eukprot:TRINITY_DN103840_c0_g1_i1.p1 TRINITY_DN103840_c0_g1~~TRINITY_DN103840_c0_g1_i1.p1  ORF type:complete len:435 (-),score=73.27 TRINITY_DN103840_c0_g1_i1:237-1541(-)
MAGHQGASVFGELCRVGGCGNAEAALASLNDKDLEEIRKLHRPPLVVKRTLEATFLILHASRETMKLESPQWTLVQKMLCDANFLTRMRSFDFARIRASPALAEFIATEYFGSQRSLTSQRSSDALRRSSRCLQAEREPLTFERVRYASQAAGALFGWCTATLVVALDLVSDRTAPVRKVEQTPAMPATVAELEKIICEDSETQEELPPQELAPASQETAHQEPHSPPQEPACQEPALLAQDPPVQHCSESEPAGPEAVAQQPNLPSQTVPEPDRHFALFASFDKGISRPNAEGELALETIAAVLCLRPQLSLELVDCKAPGEDASLNAARRREVARFFGDNGIQANAAPKGIASPSPKACSSNGEPGILCQVHLYDDQDLKLWFLLREKGGGHKSSSEMKAVIDMLEGDLHVKRHSRVAYTRLAYYLVAAKAY